MQIRLIEWFITLIHCGGSSVPENKWTQFAGTHTHTQWHKQRLKSTDTVFQRHRHITLNLCSQISWFENAATHTLLNRFNRTDFNQFFLHFFLSCFALFCFRTQQNSNETKIQTANLFSRIFAIKKSVVLKLWMKFLVLWRSLDWRYTTAWEAWRAQKRTHQDNTAWGEKELASASEHTEAESH